jgi:hypothetical protein
VLVAEGHARLVVVELKGDGSSTTVDPQAIKYAAYVAACQFGDVFAMYAAYHGVDEAAQQECCSICLAGATTRHR